MAQLAGQRQRIASLVVLLLAATLALAHPANAKPRQGDSADTGDEAWIAKRLKRAGQGKAELVRIPIAYRSMGWGCPCPDVYIGTGTDAAEGPWISLSKTSKGSPGAYNERWGTVVIAEGRFTGKRLIIDLRDGPDGPEEYRYEALEFEAWRMHRFNHKRDSEGTMQVLLASPESRRAVPLMTDSRPWLVVAASVPAVDKRASARAEKLRARLVRKGYANAEVLDTRATPLLRCCHRVVVAGRFVDAKAAHALARAVRRKGFKSAYARQGW